jgi:hypothetical protein
MPVIGLLFQIFFVAAFAVTSIAVRSIWQLRYEKPLTPYRLFSILTIVGAGLLATGLTTDQPMVVLTLTSGVLCASLGWLWFAERLKK